MLTVDSVRIDSVHPGERARYVLRSSLVEPRQLRDVLLGPLSVTDNASGTSIDADDVLNTAERAAISNCAWRFARSWYEGLPVDSAAHAWLAEYPLGQLLVGTLRVVWIVRRLSEGGGPGSWSVPREMIPLLRATLERTEFVRDAELTRPAGDLPQVRRLRADATSVGRLLSSSSAGRGAARDEVLVIPGGGVNSLLRAAGARQCKYLFLAERLPPRSILLQLAFRFQLLTSQPVGSDKCPLWLRKVDEPGGTDLHWAEQAALRALPHLLAQVQPAIGSAAGVFKALYGRSRAPVAALLPDDATPTARAIVAAAALRDTPVGVVQHGALVSRDDANHLTAGHTLAWGEALPELLRSEVGDPPATSVIGLPTFAMSGWGRRRGSRRDRRTVLFIGTAGHASNLALPPRHQQALLDAVSSQLATLTSGVELVVRPHHSGGAPITLPTLPGLAVRMERARRLEDAVADASLIVTTFSTVVVDAWAMGVPVVACPGFSSSALAACHTIPGIYWCENVADAARRTAEIIDGDIIDPSPSNGPEYIRPFIGWRRLRNLLAGLEVEPRDLRVAKFGAALGAYVEAAVK